MSDLRRLKTYQMTVYMCGVGCVLCVRVLCVCVCVFTADIGGLHV